MFVNSIFESFKIEKFVEIMNNTLKRILVKSNIFLKVNMPLMLLIIIMKLKVLKLLFYYFILLKQYLNSK